MNGYRALDVEHSAHNYFFYDCRRKGSPEAANWCGRSSNDDRVTAGWVAKGVVGFAWNASASPEAGFLFPYIAVVQLNEDTLTLRDEPSIWLRDAAIAYAALTPNGREEVGG